MANVTIWYKILFQMKIKLKNKWMVLAVILSSKSIKL